MNYKLCKSYQHSSVISLHITHYIIPALGVFYTLIPFRCGTWQVQWESLTKCLHVRHAWDSEVYTEESLFCSIVVILFFLLENSNWMFKCMKFHFKFSQLDFVEANEILYGVKQKNYWTFKENPIDVKCCQFSLKSYEIIEFCLHYVWAIPYTPNCWMLFLARSDWLLKPGISTGALAACKAKWMCTRVITFPAKFWPDNFFSLVWYTCIILKQLFTLVSVNSSGYLPGLFKLGKYQPLFTLY